MAYTYSDDPVSSGTAAQQRDAVRFLSQDNVTGSMRVSDAEIAFALAEEANVYMAAARCVGIVLSKLGLIQRKRVGNTEIERELEHYTALANDLRSRGASHQVPYVGGLSYSDKLTDATDTDRVQSFFRRTMNDSAGATMPPQSSERTRETS